MLMPHVRTFVVIRQQMSSTDPFRGERGAKVDNVFFLYRVLYRNLSFKQARRSRISESTQRRLTLSLVLDFAKTGRQS